MTCVDVTIEQDEDDLSLVRANTIDCIVKIGGKFCDAGASLPQFLKALADIRKVVCDG